MVNYYPVKTEEREVRLLFKKKRVKVIHGIAEHRKFPTLRQPEIQKQFQKVLEKYVKIPEKHVKEGAEHTHTTIMGFEDRSSGTIIVWQPISPTKEDAIKNTSSSNWWGSP